MSENYHENVAYEGIEFRDEIFGSATLAFNDLIPRIQGTIFGWESNLLSWAGTTCFLKAVTNLAANFSMNYFRLPKNVLDKTDSKQCRIWWEHISSDKGRLCLRKDRG